MLGFGRFGSSRCDVGSRGCARLVGELEYDAVAGLRLRGGEAVQRQKESAGGESIDGRNLVVGSELDAVDDATLVVEIDEVVGRQPRNGRDALEGVEPEAGVGVGSQSFDEDLDGFERIGAGIDKRDTGGDEVGTSLVVGAIFPRGHGSQSTVNVRHKT